MSNDLWNGVDAYFEDRLIGPDAALAAVLKSADAAGLPAISVSPTQGKLLHLMVRMCGARRVLEVGTLAGYSAIWMARALPDGGKVVSLELDPQYAEVARKNFVRAAVADKVEVRVGKAIETLPSLASEPPFDFVFIDADKDSTAEYFTWALKLSHAGTVIAVDNVVRGGAVADSKNGDPRVIGMRRFFDAVAKEPRVSATALQTVGIKGYDGFALALVK